MTDYEAARKRVEAASRKKSGVWEQPYDEARGVVVDPKDLRALLAGPPEPSVEEIERVIAEECHEPLDYTEAAQAVQALYRSARAPQPKEPSA